jgi:flavin-dependent dehydrogenase
MMYDALVIGGGPAGATTALRLAQNGWSVALIEKSAFPRRKVCGEFLSATSLPIIELLGIDRPFFRLAGPEIRRVAIFAGEDTVSAPMPAASHPCRWGRALGREHLDTLLLQKAADEGVRVWQPWAATDMQEQHDEVRCRIQHSVSGERRQLGARVAIAAQGSWETGALPGQRLCASSLARDLFGFKARFRNSSLPPDLMPLLAFPGGYGGLVHTDNDCVSLSCCIRRDRLQQCRKHSAGRSAGEAVFEHILASCRGACHALGNARLEHKWLAVGPIRPGLRRLCAGRTFLVGNAAGEAHPVIAEGISIAIQGAWLLADTLITHREAMLDRGDFGHAARVYRDAWHRIFAGRVRRAALIATLAMHPAAARVIMPLFRSFPPLLSACTRLSGKTRALSMPTHATSV